MYIYIFIYWGALSEPALASVCWIFLLRLLCCQGWPCMEPRCRKRPAWTACAWGTSGIGLPLHLATQHLYGQGWVQILAPKWKLPLGWPAVVANLRNKFLWARMLPCGRQRPTSKLTWVEPCRAWGEGRKRSTATTSLRPPRTCGPTSASDTRPKIEEMP